jgi:hypothetical protein
VSGVLTGLEPECLANKCDEVSESATALLTSNSVSSCGNVITSQTCTANCSDGYVGASQAYTCTADGFVGQAMNCIPRTCNASHNPANGDNGDCTDELVSGASCIINCNAGYTRHTITSCLTGTLSSVATCRPDTCDASEPPARGGVGDCTARLESGDTCQPTCEDGYVPSGASSCAAGVLTAATCQPTLQCQLIYLKQCTDHFGYWSEKEQHLDYPGCEHFCNTMNQMEGTNIFGCELEAVPGESRSLKGKWCFAHRATCTYGASLEHNAAAKCVNFTGR